MNPGQLTQTRTGLLFSLCAVKRDAPVEVGGGFRRKHYRSILSSEPISGPSAHNTQLHSFLFCWGHPHCPWTHNYAAHISCWSCFSAPTILQPWRFKKLPFAVGGSGVGAGWGTHRWEWRRKDGALVSSAVPLLWPWNPSMITWNHMDLGRVGEQREGGGEAASWLTEGHVAEVQVSCPSSASSSQRYHASNSNSRLWWTPPEWRAASGWWRGCFNSEPTAIISLCCTHRMPDLLLSIDRAHFSGRGGGRRHRRFTSTCDWCVKHRVVELRSRTSTFFFGNKCFCLYIFEWVIKNLWHTSTKCFPTFIFSDESRTAAPIKHLGKKQTHSCPWLVFSDISKPALTTLTSGLTFDW